MTLSQILNPVGNRFYIVFDAVAANLKSISDLFLNITRSDNGDRYAHMNELQEIVESNHETTRDMYEVMNHTLMTPFDKEDIHFLTAGLNDVAHHTLSVVKHIQQREVEIQNAVTNAIGKNIHDLVQLLNDCLHNLKGKVDYNAIGKMLVGIKGIITNSENTLDNAVFDLMQKESRVAELIKLNDHYDAMYFLLDKYNNLANTLQTIVIKYS